MYLAQGIRIRPEARDDLHKLLNSRSRATRLAAAYALSRLFLLTGYRLQQLEDCRVDDQGLYAATHPVAQGTDILILFAAEPAAQSCELHVLEVAEVIGPSQLEAAIEDARRHL